MTTVAQLLACAGISAAQLMLGVIVGHRLARRSLPMLRATIEASGPPSELRVHSADRFRITRRLGDGRPQQIFPALEDGKDSADARQARQVWTHLKAHPAPGAYVFWHNGDERDVFEVTT